MLNRLISKAREYDRSEFLELIDKCIDILKEERLGKINYATVNNMLIEIKGPTIVVGDIHGDLEALSTILTKAKFFDNEYRFVFLGDYGDRGEESVEVYYVLLSLKIKFPHKIVLVRGNHEHPDLPFSPHDLPYLLKVRFNKDSNLIYSRLKLLFNLMYLAVIKDDKYLMLHGGIPIKLSSRKDLAYPDSEILEEVLWNDPRDDIRDYIPSLRGYGYYFGKDVTIKGLSSTNTSLLIRAHEPCNGYKTNHDGLVLTIFSCKRPYGNSKASYLYLDDKGSLIDSIELF